jgi:hypothetical protein
MTAAVRWRDEAAAVLAVLAHTGMPFTVDDLTTLVGKPPSPQMLGGAFSAAQRQRTIEPVNATIGEGNRLVRVWVRCPR